MAPSPVLADAAESAAAARSTKPAQVSPFEPTAYALIQRALAAHDMSHGRATVLLARAVYAPRTLPAKFRVSLGRDATLARIDLEQGLMSVTGRQARLIERLARATGKHWCSDSTATLPNERRTKHFVIWYDQIGGGLTIDKYAAVLEKVWATEVGSFGWARPPSYVTRPAPGGRYPVRIANPGAGVYGYVAGKGAHAGLVGNNPATAWDEGDAFASCMVLNPGFSNVGSANNLDDLKVTVAHEFLHSIQFGLGTIAGVDKNYREGAAAWIEDEVYDSINDNYQYLYPQWDQSMGAYPTADDAFYGYWLVWRGLTESFGSGPGGAEDVMQRIFEGMSKDPSKSVLPATADAFEAMHVPLSYAYHQLAIAAFFMKPCGGGYLSPLCFEEAAAYRAKADPTIPVVGTVTPTQAVEFLVRDDYAMNVVEVPDAPKSYPIYVRNKSANGQLFTSVVCDKGTALKTAVWGPVEPGDWARMQVVRKGCVGHSYVVVTNQRHSAANPDASFGAEYRVWVPYIPMEGTLSWAVSGRAAGAAANIEWSETWTESGTLTLALTRDPINLASYLVVDDGSSYTIDYASTLTEYDTLADCTVTTTSSAGGSGAPDNTAGFIGSTVFNLDPPNPSDTLTDFLGLGPGWLMDLTGTWSGCGDSGTDDPVTVNAPFVHGLDPYPACVPPSLTGHEADVAGWEFPGGWIEDQAKYDFGCSDTLAVDGGTQTITVTGSVTYP